MKKITKLQKEIDSYNSIAMNLSEWMNQKAVSLVVLDLDGEVGSMPDEIRFGDPIILFDPRAQLNLTSERRPAFTTHVAVFKEIDDYKFSNFDDLIGANIAGWENLDWVSPAGFEGLRQDYSEGDGWDLPPKTTFLGIQANQLIEGAGLNPTKIELIDNNVRISFLRPRFNHDYEMCSDSDDIELEFLRILMNDKFPKTIDGVEEAWNNFRFNNHKGKTR